MVRQSFDRRPLPYAGTLGVCMGRRGLDFRCSNREERGCRGTHEISSQMYRLPAAGLRIEKGAVHNFTIVRWAGADGWNFIPAGRGSTRNRTERSRF